MDLTKGFIKEIEKSKNLFLLGIGGGYDCFTSIPLAIELQKMKKNTFFGNLSFTSDLNKKAPKKKKNRWVIGEKAQFCLDVHYQDYLEEKNENQFDEKHGFPKNYFPEFHFSKYFTTKFKKDIGCYCFNLKKRNGDLLSVKKYTECLDKIIEENDIDTIIAIDAGADSLLKNDEEGLGTVAEDLLSMLAIKETKRKNNKKLLKFLYLVGVGTEGMISEYDFFENLEEIKKKNGYYGSFILEKNVDSVKTYLDCLENSILTNSTINAQIRAAILGKSGYYTDCYLSSRGLKYYDVWIDKIMKEAHIFNFDICMDYKLFVDELLSSTSLMNLESKLEVQRLNNGITSITGKYIGDRDYEAMFPPKNY